MLFSFIKKTIAFLCIVSILGFSAYAYSIITYMPPRSINVHVIPMAFNNFTKEWSILLGKDVNGQWTDFSHEEPFSLSRSNDSDVHAQNTLAAQTHGVYQIDMQNVPSFIILDGYAYSTCIPPYMRAIPQEKIYLAIVPFKRASELFRTAQNSIKDDFAWFPASEFFSARQITRPHAGVSIPVANYVKDLLKMYLPRVISVKETSKPVNKYDIYEPLDYTPEARLD